jgi:hypothetical protein
MSSAVWVRKQILTGAEHVKSDAAPRLGGAAAVTVLQGRAVVKM